MKLIIQKILDKYSFGQKESAEIMNEIICGKQSPLMIAAFLTAFRLKGEELPELTGMAQVIRKAAVKFKVPKGTVDITGSGGALLDSFNISTIAAFIAAAAGIPVVKQVDHYVHGKCGSADILSLLGVNVDLNPAQAKQCLTKTKMAFLYAPNFHPALKELLEIRRELGIRSILNLLWPLVNPADLTGMVIGVYEEKLTTLVASVIRNLGVAKNAMVVHGVEGLDEISITGETRVSELKQGTINTYTTHPEDFGLQSVSVSMILGGTPQENASAARVILSGQENSPRTDLVLLNAAAAIVVSGKVSNMREAFAIAQKALYSGAALKKLNEVSALTAKFNKKKKAKKVKPKVKAKSKSKKRK